MLSLRATSVSDDRQWVRRRLVIKRLGRLVVWLLLAFVAGAALYPLVFLVLTSLKSDADYGLHPGALPNSLVFSNFSQAWSQAHIGKYMINSLIVVVPAAIVSVFSATLAGFAFGCFNFPFRRVLLIAVTGLMMLPHAISLIPTIDLVRWLGLSNTHLALSLVYTGLVIPFNVFMLTSYFRSLPRELLDAARVDGAGLGRFFRHIALPYARPPMLTLFVLNFAFLWNELLYALLLIQTAGSRTIMAGVATVQGEFFTSIPVLAAASLLAAVPIMVVFVLFQRDLSRGLTSGAIK